MNWTNPKSETTRPKEETGEEPVQRTPNRKVLKAARNFGIALGLPAAAVAVDMAVPNAAAATHECGVVGGIPVCKPHSSTPTPTTRPASTATTRRPTTATTRRPTTATTRGSTATTRAASSVVTSKQSAATVKRAGDNSQPPVVDAAVDQARLAAEAQAAADQARLAAEAQAAEAATRRAAIAKQLEGRDTEQATVQESVPITLPQVSTEGAGSSRREANPWVPLGVATAVIGIGGLAAVRRLRSDSTVHQDLSGQPEGNEVPVLTDQLPQDSSITVAVPASSTVPENSSVLAEV